MHEKSMSLHGIALVVLIFAAFLFPLFTSAASCPNLTRNLSFGSRGQDVVQLQNFLIAQNDLAAGNNTGYFGNLTRTAVRKFQCREMSICSGSEATNGYGSVGPRTRAAINTVCKGQTQTNLEGQNQSPPCVPYIPTCRPGTHAGGICGHECLLDDPTKPLAPSCKLYAQPETISPGQSSLLWWNSTDATSANIDNGIGSVHWSSSKTISPTQTTTYTMTVTGAGGSAKCSTTLTVSSQTSCTPLPAQTQTLGCPAGQTGSITQTRTSICPGPTWSEWQTTSNTCVNIPAVSYIDRGWDPGLLNRRAAFHKTDPAIYFESCPDDAAGCYNNGAGVPIGGGFYTLSPALGVTSCKVNSGASVAVSNSDGTARQEACPFYFAWTTSPSGHPAAKVTLDTSQWTSSFTSNNYFGFHENLPQGSTPSGLNYFGGQNLPTIDTARMQLTLAGTIVLPTNDSSRGRFLTGISWYVPSMQKSITLEMNLNNVSNQYTEAAWSTSAAATPNPNCSAAETCLYLGAQYWGISSVTQNGTSLAINWASIAKQLVVLGYLPVSAYGSYQTSVFYAGPETLGKAKAELTISDFRVQSSQ